WTKRPPPVVPTPFPVTVTSFRNSKAAVDGANLTPTSVEEPLLPITMTCSSVSECPDMKFTPARPVPAPLMERFLRTTLIVPPPESLMLTPFVPEFRPLPNVPPQSNVMDLVIVTVPKPPGSIQSISPPAAVLEIAPWKVLQGAVRLHGLASSPTPETQVRVACALASELQSRHRVNAANRLNSEFIFFM